MALSLLQNATYIMNNGSTPFLGTGGIEPYVYSVDVGLGTISNTGMYTAPANGAGEVVIKVVDANLDEATAGISFGTPLHCLANIIETELQLPPGRILIYDQKNLIPKDASLWISIGVLSNKIFGSSSILDASGNEIQSVNIMQTVTIDFSSRDMSALLRKEEIMMALESQYSQRLQQAGSFMIARVPKGLVDLSNLDASAIPYRFQLTVNMQYSKSKVKSALYYDNYQTPVVVTDP